MPIKSRKVFFISLLFFFLALLTALLFIDRYRSKYFTKTIETKNKKVTEIFRYFSSDIESYSITAETLQVRFKSGCINKLAKDPTELFTLRQGDRFYEVIDHHHTSSMQIEEIAEGRIFISYTSTFNHTSFGRNLIEIDRGSFQWP